MSSSNDDHNVSSSSSHLSDISFRCLACCTSSPSLFLTYKEVQDHFPAAHRTCLVTEAVLLPSSLESLQCLLCTSQPLLTEATFRAHIRTHSSFFDKEERWHAKCQRLCRICGGEVGEGIEEHLELQHPRWNFACEGDLEDDSMETEIASELSFPAMKSYEKVTKEVLGHPTEKRSPTSLTQSSSLKFHVKVEKPDISFQQPCKTESCSLTTVKPSPVAVLCRQTAATSPSASPSLPEDYPKEVPGAKTQPCIFCPSRLESITPQAHYEQKHAEEMFRCVLGSCNSSFKLFLTVKELVRHQEQHHRADYSLYRSSSYLLPVSLLYTYCDHCSATFCTTDRAPLLMHMKESHRERNCSNILYFCRVCNCSNKKLVRAEEHAERHRGSNIFRDVDVKDILKKKTSKKKSLKKQIEAKCDDDAMAGRNKEFVKQKYRRFSVRSRHCQSLLKLEEEFKDIAGFESVNSEIDRKNKFREIFVTFKTPQIATFALKFVKKLKHKDSSLLYEWRA